MKRRGSGRAGAMARTASELIEQGRVTPDRVYAATLVLARLNDRGVGFSLTLEDMCEVLGYTGGGRRPATSSRSR